MRIQAKGGEVEIPEEWIKEWDRTYYDVPKTLEKIRGWCLDHPDKRKTKRGMRGFIGNWIRQDCAMRPQERPKMLDLSEPPRLDKERTQAHLAELKGALKRGETP